jgi:hypothetical protein
MCRVSSKSKPTTIFALGEQDAVTVLCAYVAAAF